MRVPLLLHMAAYRVRSFNLEGDYCSYEKQGIRMTHFTHETFLSPFTWRYGSDEMRELWSLGYQRRVWRRLWVALAEAQQIAGLVTEEQVADLRTHQNDIDIDRALVIESDLHHDLMAEIHTYAEQCTVGAGIIHLGATSMDIEDNADALRLRDSLQLIHRLVREALLLLADLIEREADHVCMAFTHLQPAEPTTIGYRLAFTAQDLLRDVEVLEMLVNSIRGKGIKGAVGTAASYEELLKGTPVSPAELEQQVMNAIGLPAYDIAHQTYPRRQDWDVLNALAGIAMSCYKFAFDLRLLQSPPIGEWAEPFGARQIGSSAMPFKRNPIHSENMNSLARYVASLPRVAWDNGAHSLLERTLDDSGNRRIILAEGFLASDELLRRLIRLTKGLRIHDVAVARNVETYGVFAATERVMMEAARHGADRQQLHEVIRQHSLTAWEQVQHGQPNPLAQLLSEDGTITQYLASETITALLDASAHVGNAPVRAVALAKRIREHFQPAP